MLWFIEAPTATLLLSYSLVTNLAFFYFRIASSGEANLGNFLVTELVDVIPCVSKSMWCAR